MRGLLAIARREIAQRCMLFVAAAIAAAIPFLVPLLRGLHGAAATEARTATALAFSAAFLYAVNAFLGGTVLPRGLSERRIGFDFARPLSSWAIWGGTLLGTIVLATASAAIAWAPSALAGGTFFWPNLVDFPRIPLPWPVLVLGASLLLFAVFQAAGVAIRARSPLLAVDLLLVPVALSAASNGLIRLVLAGAGADASIRAVVGLALVGLVALLLAGYAAVGRGRTSIRAAHVAQSLVLWTTVGAGILGLHVYAWWLFSAAPGEMTEIRATKPAPRGSWILVDGVARGVEANFLYDTSGQHYTRIPWGVGDPTFSEDGLRAAWISKLGKSESLRIVDLGSRRPSPETMDTLPAEAAELILDGTGSRAAVVEKEGVSIYDLQTKRLLASARIGAFAWSPRLFFANRNLLRMYWFSSGAEKTRLDIFEFEVPSRRLTRTGTIDGLSGWPLLRVDRTGRRLACLELEQKRLRLFDGQTGQLIAPLLEPGRFGSVRFLFDGRIVVVSRRDSEHVLNVISPDGVHLKEIVLPSGPQVSLGGEALSGQLVVGTGEIGDQTAYLVNVDSGELLTLGQHLEPVSRWLLFFGPPNTIPPPGAEASKLFRSGDGALIRLDPSTGERRVLLGGAKR